MIRMTSKIVRYLFIKIVVFLISIRRPTWIFGLLRIFLRHIRIFLEHFRISLQHLGMIRVTSEISIDLGSILGYFWSILGLV